MANSDKDIKITPNTGESAKPKIEVVGADNATKTITVNDDGSITFDSALTVSDLTVSGTTTTLNTATMTVEDKNVVLGSGNSTSEVVDATGITLEGGSGDDITFQYNATDNRMELKHGSSFEDFKAGTITGTFVGNVTGNASGSAATVTGAAQSAITSLGTLTTLTVDNVIINGTTIGHTDDTDLITLADGAVTVAGTLQGSQLRVGGSANRIGSPATNELAIFTNSTERVRIDSSGNVGIGTTDPGFKLEVSGTTKLSGNVTLGSSYIDNVSMIGFSGDGGSPNGILSDGQFGVSESSDKLTIWEKGTIGGSGVTTAAFTFDHNGHFSAVSKSFDIQHPTKEGMRLLHGSLEGPEHGVYHRGVGRSRVVDLPDYWTGLVDEDSITVQLTPRGGFQSLYVSKIEGNRVYVDSDHGEPLDFYFNVYGERKDVDKLVVEY